jgi:hypothetical protein
MPSPFQKIRVMISSRNKDLIPDKKGSIPLEEIRKSLQKELQEGSFCGQQILEVWINEEAGAADGTEDAWQFCMDQIDQADLVIVIYNGQAGWTQFPRGGIGICHAEFHHAWRYSPSKVRLIGLQFENDANLKLIGPEEVSQKSKANKRFKDEIERIRIFQDFASDSDSLKAAVKLAIASGITKLVHYASREGHRGKDYWGGPLDWSRLNYAQRKKEIEKSAIAFLKSIGGTSLIGKNIVLELSGQKVLFQIHGIPAAFGVPEARELVGRPYLHEHESLATKEKLLGPVHVLACHKKCTEAQLTKFMGHPDLFMVQAPFGYFVADQTSFVQAFFLLDCVDDVSTRLSFQRLFDWMKESGEFQRIIDRAASRSRILQTIINEIAQNKKE